MRTFDYVERNASSPLAEGRELKYFRRSPQYNAAVSPLAEGRELKFCRDFQRGKQLSVAPRGGA